MSSPDIENRNFYNLCLYKWNDRVRGFSTAVFCNYEDCIIVGFAEARKLLNHQSAVGKINRFPARFPFLREKDFLRFPFVIFFSLLKS